MSLFCSIQLEIAENSIGEKESNPECCLNSIIVKPTVKKRTTGDSTKHVRCRNYCFRLKRLKLSIWPINHDPPHSVTINFWQEIFFNTQMFDFSESVW